MSLLNKYPSSWRDENSPNLDNILNACQLIFDRLSFEINRTKQGLSINGADDWYLDLHGDDLQTYRVPGESDEDYRIRVLDEMLRKRNTVSSVLAAVNSIKAGQSAQVYEPWKNLFCIGRSKLSGTDKIIDYKYWNYHVIEVLILVKPDLVERSLQKIISAGKTLYVTQKLPSLTFIESAKVNSSETEQNFMCLVESTNSTNYTASDLVLDYMIDDRRITSMVSTSAINSDQPFSDIADLGSIQMVYSIKNEIQGVDY